MKKSIATPEYKVLTESLQLLRVSRNLTQAELADRLRVPQSFVSKYESGERRIDLIELNAICAAVGVRLEDFVRSFEKKLP